MRKLQLLLIPQRIMSGIQSAFVLQQKDLLRGNVRNKDNGFSSVVNEHLNNI